MRAPSKERRVLMGWQWFMENMNGRPLRHIGRAYNKSTITVAKYIKEAVEGLTEAAQANVIRELIPKVAELYAAALDAEIQRIKTGATPNLELADRLMKGMYVLDDPLGRKLANPPAEAQGQLQSPEPETLFGFIGGRMPAPPKLVSKPTFKVLDAKVTEEAGHGENPDQVRGDSPAQDDSRRG